MACFASSMIGAILCFLLGRYLCAKGIRKRCITKYSYLRALDNGIKENGIKLVLLLRLAFFIPFTLLSYALGTTQLSLLEYILGSLTMVIVLFFQVFLGCSIMDISSILQGSYTGSPTYKALIITGIAFTLAVLLLLIFITKRELQKLDEKQPKFEQPLEENRSLLP